MSRKIQAEFRLLDTNETREAAARLNAASAKEEGRKKKAGAKAGKQPEKEEQKYWKLLKRGGEKRDKEQKEGEKDRENDQPQMTVEPPLQPLLDTELSLSNVLNDNISNQLISNASRCLSGLVGMDAHIEAMFGLLDLESSNEIRVIGIWGIGGIGKTTLARYVCEQISAHFQAFFFLENVSITYQDNGPSRLQEELSKNLQESILRRSSSVGSEDIEARFRHQKVLLVADDVDNIEQLDIVAEYAGRFDTGSRIIVTTRDKGLLVACRIKHVYEVECLGHSEALQLFSQYAFKRNHPYIGFEHLSDCAVKLAGGLPLALKVFGSYLHGRGKDDWESVLRRLEASTQRDIVDRAKISPDELDEEGKPNSSSSLSGSAFAMARDFDGLVAMDRQMKVMYRLLDLDSNIKVHMIGICGMEGVGKTTLARYAYEKISHQFQNHCFLRNINKFYQDHGPLRLQEEFLSKSLGGEALTVRNLFMGTDVIKARLGDRKVLLVADGVDKPEQLDVVAKDISWFGSGSVVIVTTQDKSLLDKCKVNHVYEVECLRYDEALQLFSQYAFKQRHPSTGFECLSLRAIQLAGFLPLALRVLGSFLCGKCKEDWERALHRLEALLDEDTLEILKISYEGQEIAGMSFPESSGSAGIEPDRSAEERPSTSYSAKAAPAPLAEEETAGSKPIVLVTNANGIHSPGLIYLVKALVREGLYNVHVCAPQRDKSASSHSMTLGETIAVSSVDNGGAKAFEVAGTLVDCISLALSGALFSWSKPVLVINGINRGSSCGYNMFYSGVVAGAMEALICGVPSLSVSLNWKKDESQESDFKDAVAVCLPLINGAIRDIEKGTFPSGCSLHIEIPTSPSTNKGFKVTKQSTWRHSPSWLTVSAKRHPGAGNFMSNQQSLGIQLAQLARYASAAGAARRLTTQKKNVAEIESVGAAGKSDSRVKKYFRLEFLETEEEDMDDDLDIKALEDGFVSVTPLSVVPQIEPVIEAATSEWISYALDADQRDQIPKSKRNL